MTEQAVTETDRDIAEFLGYQVYPRVDRENGDHYFALVDPSGDTVPPFGPIWPTTASGAWELLHRGFARSPETFVVLLDKMRELGSSINVGYDEEAKYWVCTWVTGGKRYVQLAGDPINAAIYCVLKTFKKYQVI